MFIEAKQAHIIEHRSVSEVFALDDEHKTNDHASKKKT